MRPPTPLGRKLEQKVRAGRRRSRRLALLGCLSLLAVGGALLALGREPDSGSGLTGGPGQELRADRNADQAATDGRDPRRQPARFTVSTSGDLLIHSPVWQDALANGGGEGYDFDPMFRPIRRYVKGVDLAICHVETPITTGPPSGFPIFSAPAELAAAIRKAGWRACDTASNHSVDRGQEGIDETGRLLTAQKVRHTGSARSAAAARRPVILNAGPARVGLVAYTDATNGIPPPSPWSVNVLPAAEPARSKAARVERDVRRTLAAGADTVIVNLQWGDENSPVPNRSQRALARRVLAIDGVAAIAGQGPHVVQPIERIRGKFVIFSSGNLLSNQSALAGLPVATQDGLIALLRFVETEGGFEVRRVDYVPTMVELDGHAVLPAGRGSSSHPELAGALADSWQRTVDVAGRGPNLRPIPAKRP